MGVKQNTPVEVAATLAVAVQIRQLSELLDAVDDNLARIAERLPYRD